MVEAFVPDLVHYKFGWWTYTLEPRYIIDPIQRLAFALPMVVVMAVALRKKVFRAFWQWWAAIAAILICLAESTLATGRMIAVLLHQLFWKNIDSSTGHQWYAYQGSYTQLLTEWLYGYDSKWTVVFTWSFLVAMSVLCMAIVWAPTKAIPNWSPTRERVLRLLILPLCLINLIYLCYVLGEYAYPIYASTGTEQLTAMSVKVVAWIRTIAVPFLIIPATVFFAKLAFKPGALLDPTRCDRCDYPLEPSFTTCPECGTERSVAER